MGGGGGTEEKRTLKKIGKKKKQKKKNIGGRLRKGGRGGARMSEGREYERYLVVGGVKKGWNQGGSSLKRKK